jgi:hypothetical protein
MTTTAAPTTTELNSRHKETEDERVLGASFVMRGGDRLGFSRTALA